MATFWLFVKIWLILDVVSLIYIGYEMTRAEELPWHD